MKIALFLGAGASVFASQPTAAEMLKCVRDRVRDRKDEQYGNRKLKGYITSIVENSAYSDVEELYDGVDRIATIGKHSNCKPIIDKTIAKGISLGEIIDEMNGLKVTIREVLLDLLIIREGKIKLIKHVYDDVLSIMKYYETDKIHVFTTNYDAVVEEYCNETNLDVVNGFKPYRHKKSVWANAWDYDGMKPSLYLTKLHGSIYWSRDADGKIVETGGVEARDASDDIMIAPTEGVKEYDKKPFPELMCHFKKAIEGIDVLLVIGFSYRDKEIVSIIKDRVERGMILISVSPSTVTDIRNVFGADAKIKETNNQQIKVIGSKIILCEQEFGLDTDQTMNIALKMAYKRIQQEDIRRVETYDSSLDSQVRTSLTRSKYARHRDLGSYPTRRVTQVMEDR